MSKNTAPQRPDKPAAAVRRCAVSFAGQLDQGELLIGTPTLSASGAGLTVYSPAVSAAALTLNGRLVPAGRAVEFWAGGGTAGVEYTVTVTAQTTLGQTLIGRVTIFVEA